MIASTIFHCVALRHLFTALYEDERDEENRPVGHTADHPGIEATAFGNRECL
jgi:hypothetical protein